MIYFDNSASSPLCEAAKEALINEMELPANPSSLHRIGFEAQIRLENARKNIASSIGASPEEIFFTSGGTESDNIAIFGAAEKTKRLKKKIITSDSEHPAVSEVMKKLSESGWEICELKTKGGEILLSELENNLTSDTALLSIMHTNNETGAAFDIASLFKRAKELCPDIITMTDAVQGYMKAPINPKRLYADMISLSSHKIHGPKGVGALYIKKGLNLKPHTMGGGQEKGLRNGTENLPGIVSFGAAAKYGAEHLEEYISNMNNIREYIMASLCDDPKIHFNIPKKASCHIISMQAEGFKSEVLLHLLSDRDIFVSSGSACSSHKGKSKTLLNFGLSEAEADRTIRISLSAQNTLDEAKEFIRQIKILTAKG